MVEDGEETTGGETTHLPTRAGEDTAAAIMGKAAARSSMSRAPWQGRSFWSDGCLVWTACGWETGMGGVSPTATGLRSVVGPTRLRRTAMAVAMTTGVGVGRRRTGQGPGGATPGVPGVMTAMGQEGGPETATAQGGGRAVMGLGGLSMVVAAGGGTTVGEAVTTRVPPLTTPRLGQGAMAGTRAPMAVTRVGQPVQRMTTRGMGPPRAPARVRARPVAATPVGPSRRLGAMGPRQAGQPMARLPPETPMPLCQGPRAPGAGMTAAPPPQGAMSRVRRMRASRMRHRATMGTTARLGPATALRHQPPEDMARGHPLLRREVMEATRRLGTAGDQVRGACEWHGGRAAA